MSIAQNPFAQLHAAIAAVCPIDGVSIGDPNDPSTWSVQYQGSATSDQIAAAQSVIASFNYGDVCAQQQLAQQAKNLLDDSDVTMHRLAEAVVLGLNQWTNQDVIDFVNYRRQLRAIVKTGVGSIPPIPIYPIGT